MSYKAPRGTHDVLPSEAPTWQFVEHTFQSLVELYGYGEIRTPVFEESDLFIRSSGDTSDIVTKQMYRFQDQSERDLCLKPEGTAPAIRAYLEHNLGTISEVSRLWYATPIFRYERPQKGRYRQAHQVGLELIGSTSSQADAEVIEITLALYRRLGIERLNLKINSIGRAATRAAYREAILAHAQCYLADLDDEAQARALKNPLRLLDSKDPKAIEAMASAPSILDFLESESRQRFDELQSILARRGLAAEVDSSIVRGLDYYTDTVFEVSSPDLGAQSALCGGGRYDNLIQEMGGPSTPSVGVAMGIERAIMAIEATAQPKPTSHITVFVANISEDLFPLAEKIALDLRAKGISAQFDLDNRKFKNQIKLADKLGADFTAVVGETEAAAGEVTLKDMQAREQSTVPQHQLAEVIGAKLAKR